VKCTYLVVILGVTYSSITGGLHCFQKGLKEQNNESIKLPALLLGEEGSPELSSYLRARQLGV